MTLFRIWQRLRNQNISRRRKMLHGGGRRYTPFDCLGLRLRKARTFSWRAVWRRLKKEKNTLLDCNNPEVVQHMAYDPQSYAQNFDQGSMLDDPDGHSRSFSARFAVQESVLRTLVPSGCNNDIIYEDDWPAMKSIVAAG